MKIELSESPLAIRPRSAWPWVVLVLLVLLSYGCAGARKPTSQISIFYPMPPDRPRIQYLTTITDEVDVGAKKRALMEFVTGKKETKKRLGRPWDLAHDDGKLYVVDRQYSSVIIIDLIAREFGSIGYDKGGRLVNPVGIFVTPEGLKYIADKERRQIMVFDAKDEFLRSYALDDDSQPLDVAVAGGRLYVCDMTREEVLVLDLESGEIIDRIGGQGQAEGMFRWPTHLTGEVLMPFGKLGGAGGGNRLPAGIHIDYDNLEYFSQYVDANFLPKYLIYVCNQAGPRKLNVYAFGDWIDPGN